MLFAMRRRADRVSGAARTLGSPRVRPPLRREHRRAALAGVALGLAAILAPGCSSSSTPSAPTIEAARTFHLAGFTPTGPVRPGVPFVVAFRIDQPSGAALVDYRRGAGPHTGVHLIVVRKDLSVIIHRHPKIQPDGSIRQPIVLPQPGPYRVLVDAYPNLTGPQRNFQLFSNLRAAGAYKPRPLPAVDPTQVVSGYRVTLQGASHLKAIQPAFVKAIVTDPNGRPAKFAPWYGALAHAIFFRARSLDYFHTHVCAPGATGCASLGGAGITGQSTKPGRLNVGVLVPLPGTWRLFLQFKANGRVLTAPFTLRVR
jgi:hypothetical protein